MVRRINRWALLAIAFLVMTGCTAGVRRPAREMEQAVAAVMGYMESRRNNDLAAAYRYLSKETQQLYRQDEFVNYYRQFPVMQWRQVGQPTVVVEDWVRIVVYDITVTYEDGHEQTLPDFPYYVHQSGGKWGVAMLNPALGRYDGLSSAQEVIDLSNKLLKTHPYHFTVHTQLFYAFLATGDLDKARETIETLYRISVPSDLAALQVDKATYYLAAQQAAPALSAAQTALSLADAYPDRYAEAWRSDIRTLQAKAQALIESGR